MSAEVAYTNLEVVDGVFKIPAGAVKEIPVSVLKAERVATHMLLFPNFPAEIQLKVLNNVLDDKGKSDLVVVTESAAGLKAVRVLPEVAFANKLMLSEYLRSGVHFIQGVNRVVPSRPGDTIKDVLLKEVQSQLGNIASTSAPTMILANNLIDPEAAARITTLRIEVQYLLASLDWIKYNIMKMPSLQSLHLDVIVGNPADDTLGPFSIKADFVIRMDYFGDDEFSPVIWNGKFYLAGMRAAAFVADFTRFQPAGQSIMDLCMLINLLFDKGILKAETRISVNFRFLPRNALFSP